MLTASSHGFDQFSGALMKIDSFSRRDWLKFSSVGVTAACVVRRLDAADQPRPKVAAVFTEFRMRSHAFHILTSLMGRYLFRGQWIDPGVDVVSFYADQF